MQWNIVILDDQFNIKHVERCDRKFAFDETKDLNPADLPDVVINVANITFSKKSLLISEKVPGYFLVYCGDVDFTNPDSKTIPADPEQPEPEPGPLNPGHPDNPVLS